MKIWHTYSTMMQRKWTRWPRAAIMCSDGVSHNGLLQFQFFLKKFKSQMQQRKMRSILWIADLLHSYMLGVATCRKESIPDMNHDMRPDSEVHCCVQYLWTICTTVDDDFLQAYEIF